MPLKFHQLQIAIAAYAHLPPPSPPLLDRESCTEIGSLFRNDQEITYHGVHSSRGGVWQAITKSLLIY